MEQRDRGHAAGLGRAVRRRCGCRSCSTCAPTRSSGPTSRRTPTTTGCIDNAYLVFAAQIIMTRVPRRPSRSSRRGRRPASFTIDQAVEKLQALSRRALSRWEPPELLDRRGDEVGDHRLRRPGHRRGWERLRRARRPGRGLRQRRHPVVREAAADPARLHHQAASPVAEADPELRDRQPYKAAYEDDLTGWARRWSSTTTATTATCTC